MDTNETLKEIRRSFRLLMNGVASQSMREKGSDYHINWGASLLHLKEMASEYTPNKELAIALWKDNVRECKILATMLMPHTEFDLDLAQLWIEQTRNQEIAEIAAMNLYQHMPYAKELSLKLIASPNAMSQLQGYAILSRRFTKGVMDLDTREANEFIDQAIVALQDSNGSLKHAAWNAIIHFSDIDEMCYAASKNALKTIKMDDCL